MIGSESKVRLTSNDTVVAPVRVKVQTGMGAALRMLRRTVRKMIGTRAPALKLGKGNYVFLAPSAPGEPLYKRKGGAYDRVGYDLKTGKASEGFVSVDSYGWEVNGKHPHLKPAYDLNKNVLLMVAEGRMNAPQYGNLGKSEGRKAFVLKPPKKKSGGKHHRSRPKRKG